MKNNEFEIWFENNQKEPMLDRIYKDHLGFMKLVNPDSTTEFKKWAKRYYRHCVDVN